MGTDGLRVTWVLESHMLSWTVWSLPGSAYASDGRSALPDDPSGLPWAFASQVAEHLDPPEDVYVMDVCEVDGQLRLLELNPFSGADLYACDCHAVVAAVTRAATRTRQA